MPRENEHEFLTEVLLGDMQAVTFCETLFQISQIWDDLIDKDNPVTSEDINRMMWLALVVLPGNQFYKKWEHELRPMFKSFIVDWMDANTFEAGKDRHMKTVAFVIRSSVSMVVTHCAYLVGGWEHMRKVSPLVRMHMHEDKLEDYMEGV